MAFPVFFYDNKFSQIDSIYYTWTEWDILRIYMWEKRFGNLKINFLCVRTNFRESYQVKYFTSINSGKFRKKPGKFPSREIIPLKYNQIYSGAKLRKPHVVKNAKQLNKFGTH